MPADNPTTSPAPKQAPLNSGVYVMWCSATDKVYVGSTKSFNRRRTHHYCYLGKGTHKSKSMQADWDRYGPAAFSFIILERVSTDRMIAREQVYLDDLHATDERFGYNTNPRADGPRGRPISMETRYKISQAHMGMGHTPETKAKLSETSRKRRLTPEQRVRLSEALKGREFTEQHRARLAEASRGVVFSEERKAKIGAASRARRDKMSAMMREYWRRRREEKADENSTASDRDSTNK